MISRDLSTILDTVARATALGFKRWIPLHSIPDHQPSVTNHHSCPNLSHSESRIMFDCVDWVHSNQYVHTHVCTYVDTYVHTDCRGQWNPSPRHSNIIRDSKWLRFGQEWWLVTDGWWSWTEYGGIHASSRCECRFHVLCYSFRWSRSRYWVDLLIV